MRVVFTHLIGPRKGESERFDSSAISIGRALDNVLSFPDDKRVSAHHARMARKGKAYELRDLGSTNGTMINGRRIAAATVNQDDLIEFGAGGPLGRFGIEPDGAGAIPDRTTAPP